MKLIDNIGQIGARFATMRIVHPNIQRLFDLCDKLRTQKRESRARDEQSGGMFFSETHSGKSTAIKMYLETVVVDDCYRRELFPRRMSREEVYEAQRLVVYIALSPDTTLGSLFGDLLEALGDPEPHNGTIPARRRRAYILMKGLGVELLIFDEIDHLKVPVDRGNSNRESAMSAHNQLKMFMKNGYPVLFVGIPEAKYKLFNEKQIKGITTYNIVFEKLNVNTEIDRVVCKEYLGNMGLSIREKGIMLEDSIFALESIYVPLTEACGGFYGYYTRFLVHAAENAFLDKAKKIERHHLVKTADEYTPFLPRDKNPFKLYDEKKRLERLARAKLEIQAAE